MKPCVVIVAVFLAAVEPHSLKELSRLVILQHLGRANYTRVSELPLPQHLKVRVTSRYTEQLNLFTHTPLFQAM